MPIQDTREPAAPEFLRPPAAAKRLKTSNSYLNKRRCDGTGPEYIQLPGGIILYTVNALDSWALAHARKSTSEGKQTSTSGDAA